VSNRYIDPVTSSAALAATLATTTTETRTERTARARESRPSENDRTVIGVSPAVTLSATFWLGTGLPVIRTPSAVPRVRSALLSNSVMSVRTSSPSMSST